MRMLGSPFPLYTSSFAVDAEARAVIIRALCGLSRYVNEIATGQNAVTTEVQCTPQNPQGLIGVDLSGPPWGPALRHIIGGTGAMKPTADVLGDRTVFSIPTDTIVSAALGGYTKYYTHFDKAPYSRRYVYLRAWTNAGGPLNLAARIIGPSGNSERSTTLSITNTTETTYNHANLWIEPDGGSIEFNNTSGTTIHIGSITLNNVQKLAHS